MKRLQSVLCALALAIALSPTALAGNIHGIKATTTTLADGNIHGVSAYDYLGILITDAFVAILGNIHG
jgi:hypothetical protein